MGSGTVLVFWPPTYLSGINFGLFISGVFSLGFLQQEKKFNFHDKPLGYPGSFLVGAAFAAGWTSCVGPILSSIFLYASTGEDMRSGILLLGWRSRKSSFSIPIQSGS